MKKFIFIVIFFPIFLFAIELKVNVSSIETLKKGKLYIGIFNNAKDFPNKNKNYQKKVFNIRKYENNLTTSFDLIEGVYAVAIFHDENLNSNLDTNFFGIPTEGYGFSNNGLFPIYNNSKFLLNQDLKIYIEMRY